MTTALVESVLMVAGLHPRLGYPTHPRQHTRASIAARLIAVALGIAALIAARDVEHEHREDRR